MNRYSRFSLFFLLSGALLLPVGLYAQEKNNQAAPTDQQQDTGKKKDAPVTIRYVYDAVGSDRTS